MVMKRRAGAAFVDVAGVRRRSGAEWKLCDFVRRWSGSAWVDVWRGITAYVSGYFNQVSQAGLGRVYDDGQFSADRLPTTAPAITSYQWDFVDYGGMLRLSGGTTGPVLRLRGPAYSTQNFPQQYQVDIWCDVTIGGTVYRTQTFTAYYQAGFA